MADGEHDQDRGIVAPGADQHARRFGNAHRLQGLVAGGIAGHDVDPELLGLGETILGGIDHHDTARVDPAFDQLADALAVRDAIAKHHHVAGQLFLDAGHAKLLPAALDDEIVGRAHEDEQHRDPHRRDDHRLDQPRAVRDRGDVAKARGGDADHGEIDHIEKADVIVVIVLEPGTVPPVDHHHQRDKPEGQCHADAEIAPDRYPDLPPQRLKLLGQQWLALERVAAGLGGHPAASFPQPPNRSASTPMVE